MARDTVTQAIGVSVDETGRIVCKYYDADGARQTIDLTAYIEKVAANAVAEHVKTLHPQAL